MRRTAESCSRPAACDPSPLLWTHVLVHTYSKITLSPGQRLGYLALPGSMPEREGCGPQRPRRFGPGGFGLPDAVMQYALADIELLSIHLAHLERKRDRMVTELRRLGYRLHVPKATFYLLPESAFPTMQPSPTCLPKTTSTSCPARWSGCPWLLPHLADRE
jgi:aspartate aminotransferase